MHGGYYLYSGGTLNNQSSYGFYWSRRLTSAARGYYLGLNSGLVNPQANYDRGYGYALRCLHARTTPILAPLSLVRGGDYYHTNGIPEAQSSFGFYWPRRLSNATDGNRLYFDFGHVFSQNSLDRGRGYSIRCLAR